MTDQQHTARDPYNKTAIYTNNLNLNMKKTSRLAHLNYKAVCLYLCFIFSLLNRIFHN